MNALFENLYHSHYKAVLLWTIAQGVSDFSDAASIANDTFVDFSKVINKGITIRYPKSLLWKIANHRLIDYRRRKTRLEKLPIFTDDADKICQIPSQEKDINVVDRRLLHTSIDEFASHYPNPEVVKAILKAKSHGESIVTIRSDRNRSSNYRLWENVRKDFKAFLRKRFGGHDYDSMMQIFF